MGEKSYHLHQIDVIKGIAIILVVLNHLPEYWDTYNHNLILRNFITTHNFPILIILMGLNYGTSFKRRGLNGIKDIYSKDYFIRIYERFVFPFFLIYLLSFFLLLIEENIGGYIAYVKGLVIGETPKSAYFLGLIPHNSPGNEFIFVLFEFLLIFPLIYKMYIRNQKFTLITCFLINVFTEIYLIDNYENYLLANQFFFRIIFLIMLGLWISDNHDIFSKRNFFLIPGIIVGSSYLFFISFKPSDYLEIGGFYILRNFWTVFLVILGLRFLPKNGNLFTHGIGYIGKLSYHIFLIQMLYTGFLQGFVKDYLTSPAAINIRNFLLDSIIFNLLLCIFLGIIFYKLEEKSRISIFGKSNKQPGIGHFVEMPQVRAFMATLFFIWVFALDISNEFFFKLMWILYALLVLRYNIEQIDKFYRNRNELGSKAWSMISREVFIIIFLVLLFMSARILNDYFSNLYIDPIFAQFGDQMLHGSVVRRY